MSGVSDQSWPDWIVAVGDDMRQALTVLASVHSRLAEKARDGYLPTRLAQGEVNPVLDHLSRRWDSCRGIDLLTRSVNADDLAPFVTGACR
jgi:hypothetical protein